MKKFIVFILILALILPAAALAADRDPIIGSWYLLFDATLYPELKDQFSGYDLIVIVFSFMEDGTVIQTENDILDNKSNTRCWTVGKWEKDNNKYTYSLIGYGVGEAVIDGNSLRLMIQENYFMLLRRMTEYNPYTDARN